ncbi:MAG: LptF/LptG family permease [Crocinitomicaceae bacterium]|nr:LptF/LptG family permease [Crocinitomicaceae bacterium]
MQFFWKYIDDLMGKGLSASVIIELLFYISASLIPLALPLAILLSSIMTFGNLSENNELTALKASGLSLYRIIRPLTVVVLFIALGTFFFANYVIPVSTLKWHSLIYDIQNTKISSIIKPGSYSTDLDGYAIKVDEGNDDAFKGVLIHDHTSPNEIKSIRAKEGRIYKSANGKFLFFELKDGTVMEELAPQSPSFSEDGISHSPNSNHPSRRSSFKQATYKIDLQGFDLSRSQEDLFNDKHDMLNVFQIQYTIDSIQASGQDIIENFLTSIKNDHAYLNAHNFQDNSKLTQDDNIKETYSPDTILVFDELTNQEKIAAITMAQTKLRNKNKNLDSQKNFLVAMDKDIDQYLIEFHRKFALTFAIIILFFVGAPLGAIVRKGGFGAPVVIAALLFMVYFVLITIGDNMAKADSVSPFVGMWFASLVLLPIAIWLMRAAANDAPLFSFPPIKNPLKRK